MIENTFRHSTRRDGKPAGPELGPWSKIPSKFFGSGTAAILGPSASLCYLGLCEHANRNSSNEFKASDRALASETGLSTRTICNARKRLIEKRLICCERGNGESFTYTLLKQAFKWVSLAERPRQKRRPRSIHALRSTSEAPKANSKSCDSW
jgi:hypothetical protein